jgi:hypothetical protein
MLKWAANVLSGTYAHWNRTNGRAFSEFFARVVEGAPADVRPVLVECCSSAYLLVEALIGPDSTSGILTTPSRLKHLSRDNFTWVYVSLVCAFAWLYPYAGPEAGLRVLGFLAERVGDEPVEFFRPLAPLSGVTAVAQAANDQFAQAIAPALSPVSFGNISLTYLFQVQFLTHCRFNGNGQTPAAAA